MKNGTNLMVASNQWASRPSDQRFQTLDALYASVAARRKLSRATDIPVRDVSAVVSNGELLLNHGIKEVALTHWSMGQLCSWTKAPAAYMRSLPVDLAAQNLNHGIQKFEGEKSNNLKFMTVVSEDENQHNRLQALTSTTYGRIWDADVVECAKRIVDKTGGKFFNPKAYNPGTGEAVPSGLYASDRDVFIFMIDGGSLLEAGPRAQLNRGFIMSNSETGARKFNLMTFLFNVVCGNHIIWGATDIHEISIRHSAGGPTRFDRDAMPQLEAYVNASAAPEISAIKRAQDMLLPCGKKDEEIVKWLQSRKFTKTEATETVAFARREEGDCRTIWHAVQGGTAYARGFDWVDSRVEMETKASDLMELVK